MKELEKDMAMLRNGMKEVGREVEFYRTQPPVNGDRYVNLLILKNSEVICKFRSKQFKSAKELHAKKD